MTPTMKIKRRVVMREYQKVIDDLYHKTDQEWSKPIQSFLIFATAE